ncbi:MAG: serine/threonine protein kinase [Bdellovibrio sp.]|nr:MAG: serine/threonine protein kinase [Bdellovibrio sp.]
MENSVHKSFNTLEPETILQAMESAGLQPTGEMRQLNSFENRVFEISLEKPPHEHPQVQRVVAKFYRPGRWSRRAIEEEHQFLRELEEEHIPVAPPLRMQGQALFQTKGILFAIFPKIYGRMPDEILPREVRQVGRLMAQVHLIGARSEFRERPRISGNPVSGWETLEFLRQWVAVELWPRYESAAVELLDFVDEEISPVFDQRIHGDFHRGNLLANKDQFLLVDFDDCVMGPVVQDLWMIADALEPEEQEELIAGYSELREFPEEQLHWIPLMRGLRIFNYAAWIARRWQDPSFPRLFPDFNTYTSWAEETEALEAAVRAYVAQGRE